MKMCGGNDLDNENVCGKMIMCVVVMFNSENLMIQIMKMCGGNDLVMI